LIRLPAGIEDVDDLWADLAAALDAAGSERAAGRLRWLRCARSLHGIQSSSH
jgi:hypothetical protein